MRVSVVIPVYNEENYIEQCINSVLNQTKKPDEIVIVNDGSTDRTEEIIKKYQENNPDLIKYIKNDGNKGIAVTRNNGVRNATGDYITFLSADDVFMPNYIEVMLKEAKNQPNKILFSNYYFCDTKTMQILTEFKPPNFNDCHEDFLVACWEGAYKNTMFVCFSTTFFPRKVFDEMMFDEEFRFCEDLHFLLISMKIFKYFLVQQPLLMYRASMKTANLMDKIPAQNMAVREKARKFWGFEDEDYR